jgi:hypothetical protein
MNAERNGALPISLNSFKRGDPKAENFSDRGSTLIDTFPDLLQPPDGFFGVSWPGDPSFEENLVEYFKWSLYHTPETDPANQSWLVAGRDYLGSLIIWIGTQLAQGYYCEWQ